MGLISKNGFKLKRDLMVILTPLLFVVFTFLIELKKNLYETSLVEIITLFAILAGIVLICQGVFYYLTRDKNKASVIGVLFAFMLLSFGIFFPYHPVLKYFHNYSIYGMSLGSYKFILSCYWTIFLLMVHRIYYWNKPNFIALTITKIMLFLVLLNSILLMFPVYKNIKQNTFQSNELKQEMDVTLAYNYKPDIYYIMLDGYPRPDTLKAVFNYDNISFVKFLKGHNFEVLKKNCSNYHHTTASLASVFSMDYESKSITARPPVFTFLKRQGYHLINVVSNLEFTASWMFFDEYRGDLILKTFARQFLLRTTLAPLIGRMKFFQKAYIIKNQFRELEKISGKYSEPLFVFCHILLPHLPFAFDQNGDYPKEEDDVMLVNLYDQKKIDCYKIQISTLNELLKTAVSNILKNSTKPPIIIIQSDHGSFFIGRSIAYKAPQQDFSKLEIKERMSNFSAFYLPYKGNEKLYDTMTNVNTFRVLFNHYFGTTFQILEDKCYWGGGFNEIQENTGVYTVNEINNITYPSFEALKDFFVL